MIYRHDINNCLANKLTAGGTNSKELDAYNKKAAQLIDALKKHQSENTLPLLNLPDRTDDLDQLKSHAEHFRKSFTNVIILGTGGSSLGGKTLCALADQGFGPERGGPKLHFLDNVDPATFDALFKKIDWAKTGLIVISKSGTTAETLTQFMIFLQFMLKTTRDVSKQIIAITEPGPRLLRDLCDQYDIPVLDHDPNVGGRYSVLSIVGLLPAMIAGLNVKAVRAGAKEVLDEALHAKSDPQKSRAVLGAVLNIAFLQDHKIAQAVLMPYIDVLQPFAFWYRQLWAESIGKNGKGSTPINALGTVDQHSQLQLYLDGPKDKLFTLILKKVAGNGDVVDPILASDPQLLYLAGRTMGDLLEAEQRATLETLIENNCPTRVISLDTVDEKTLGGLFMHFMLETIVACQLIDVNPFDQPAVEQGKILTRQYLSEIAPQAA